MAKFTPEEKSKFIAGLRAMADFMEAAPDDFPMPYNIDLAVFGLELTEARAAIASIGGTWAKDYMGHYVEYSREFAAQANDFTLGQVKFTLNVSRDEVCKRVEVGTRYIEATPARIEPIYEWECGPEAE